MRFRTVVLVALLHVSACAFDGSNQVASSDSGFGSEPDAPTSGGDGGANQSDAGELGCQNFASLFNACAIEPTSGDLALTLSGTYTFNTDNGVLEDPAGDPVETQSAEVSALNGTIRVLMTNSFVLGRDSALRAEGDLPFAIGAFETLSIEGLLDVGRGGAGARSNCEEGNGSAGGDLRGGGAFQGAGGNGGLGNGDGNTQGERGIGGTADNALPASPLGGCPGGDGGEGEDDGGSGGDGGGAIYLSSGTQVVISGGIQAAGDGAQGGRESGGGFADAGGGGGGSGGYIFIEAPTVVISGAIAANGGGGGEGSGDGDQGNDGQPGSLNAIAASGGADGSPTGSDGGAGSFGAVLAGLSVDVAENGGAGGGGGGAGFIIIAADNAMLAGSISPPAL